MVEKSIHAAVDRAVRRADDPRDGTPLLTVIVPVYNEAETVAEQLARILAAPYAKQVIVVDDGSTDATPHVLAAWRDQDPFEVHTHEVNRGKGAAIRTALPYARGRFTIVQDADLEYDPEDYPRLIGPLLAGEARAVFGSRYLPESPSERLSKRVASVVRAMKARLQGAMSALTVMLWGWVRKTDAEGHGSKATAWEGHPKAASGAEVRSAKRRSRRWDPRRLGEAALKLAARLLYGARLSDAAASPKAFSTELLRTLELQCERFEFGPEVTAKLSRGGEKIVEVPIRYERRQARDSWFKERFARRATAAVDRGSGRRPPAKKHRWTDGPRALATLWRWRHWAPQVPDPDRIPAVAAADGAAQAAVEAVSAGIEADIDHWVEEDASRSAFDPTAWNVAPRQRPAEAPADSSCEAEPAAASSQARPEVLSAAAAFASFEPRLLWQEFVRTALPDAPAESETDQGRDWERWNLADVVLLIAIVNLGLILAAACIPPFWSWQGLLLAVLASVVTMRATRAGRIKLDKFNQALGILATLVVCSMCPSDWVWRNRTMLILAGLALLLGIGRIGAKGFRHGERSLLDMLGAVAMFLAGMPAASPSLRVAGLLVLSAILTSFLALHWKRATGRVSDNVLLVLAAAGIFLVAVLAYLFPVNLLEISWTTAWLRFRYAVLPHWTEIAWFRWGIVGVLAAMVSGLLLYRAGRSQART